MNFLSPRSAELHFPRADLQLETARNTFSTNALSWRQQVRLLITFPEESYLFAEESLCFEI